MAQNERDSAHVELPSDCGEQGQRGESGPGYRLGIERRPAPSRAPTPSPQAPRQAPPPSSPPRDSKIVGRPGFVLLDDSGLLYEMRHEMRREQVARGRMMQDVAVAAEPSDGKGRPTIGINGKLFAIPAGDLTKADLHKMDKAADLARAGEAVDRQRNQSIRGAFQLGHPSLE